MATRKKSGAGKPDAKQPAKQPAKKPGKEPARKRAAAKRGKPTAAPRRKASGRAKAPAAGVRRGEVFRQTGETRIEARVSIGEPGYQVATGVPFLDHMLEALSRHSGIGLYVQAEGDLEVDDHHTVEDVGLAIGEALRIALGDKSGIARFGHFEAPLDESLVAVTVDLSGRPYLVYNMPLKPQRVGTFDVGLAEDFFQAFATAGGMNLHLNVRYGRNPHHLLEASFKALAKALRMACALNAAMAGVPSTKGTLA